MITIDDKFNVIVIYNNMQSYPWIQTEMSSVFFQALKTGADNIKALPKIVTLRSFFKSEESIL